MSLTCCASFRRSTPLSTMIAWNLNVGRTCRRLLSCINLAATFGRHWHIFNTNRPMSCLPCGECVTSGWN
ncbi:hypothetical protein BDR07DRAFT_1428697 [Suillus spraguei]|nr:hypothetical protein BDR07DRAFT_1428697 [Suillus spraguei]